MLYMYIYIYILYILNIYIYMYINVLSLRVCRFTSAVIKEGKLLLKFYPLRMSYDHQ